MSLPQNLPPALAVGALYDSFLQAALRQFFARATFESEPMLSACSDGRLAIEPTDDPSVLTVRWFGSRYGLRVPERRPFTTHEIRMARAIGSVLAARYHADSQSQVDGRARRAVPRGHRGPLCRGLSRRPPVSVGTAVDPRRSHRGGHRGAPRGGAVELREPPDLVGRARARSRRRPARDDARPADVARVLAGTDGGEELLPARRRPATHCFWPPRRPPASTSSTWISGRRTAAATTLPAPVPAAYQAHARATLRGGHVCVVLSPSHEIKVFAEGAQVFTFRHANWHLLDLQAKYRAVGRSRRPALAGERLFQTALDLANARQGALFVVVREPAQAIDALCRWPTAWTSARPARPRAGARADAARSARPAHRPRHHRSRAERACRARQPGWRDRHRRDRRVDRRRSDSPHAGDAPQDDVIVEGARTTAALGASRFGPVLKVSEDGAMTFYDGVRVWDL